MDGTVPDVLSVYALDGLARIGSITGYSKLRATERDIQAGEWLLEMPLGGATSTATALRLATWPGIEIVDEDTGWRFGGFLTGRGIRKKGNEPTHAVFRGLDFQGWLQGWLVWPDSADVGRMWIKAIGQGLSLTTAIHNAAVFNFGASARVERQMPDVAGIGVDDPNGGPSPTWFAENQPILELFRGWCADQPYTVRLVLARPDGDGGELRFSCKARPTVNRLFEAETGRLGDIETDEAAALASRAISMGDEDGVETGSRYVSDQVAPSTDWRFRYWERFRERPSLTQAELDIETIDWLAELGPTTSVELGEIEVGSGWGREIDLGWFADVRTEPGSSTLVSTTVAASTLTVEGGRVRRTVSLGDENLTPQEQMNQQLAAMAQRVRRLEREGQRT